MNGRVDRMRLSVAMDYGISTIVYIGLESKSSRQNKSKYVTVEEISRECEFSKNHLIKIVHLLGKSDILHTIRGRRGGIVLGKPLADISLNEVIQLFQNEEKRMNGGRFQTDVRTVIEAPLLRARQNYQDTLKQTSFEDLVNQMESKRTEK